MNTFESTPSTALDDKQLASGQRVGDLLPGGKVVVMLPAYNEAEALPKLLRKIESDFRKSDLPYEVIVVDDGSSDDTALVASQASFHMPVNCITHEKNQGLAGALRTGVIAAIAAARPGDVVVTMDADNTHPPASVETMVQMIGQGHDVVIASRFRRGSEVVGVPAHRNALSIGARYLFTLLYPIRGVRDYTCGYRAYSYDILQKALEHFGDRLVSEQGFSCMVDMLLKLNRFKPTVGEVPFTLRYDQKAGASKMKVAATVWQTIHLLVRRRMFRP